MIDFVRAWSAAVASALYWGFGGAAFLITALILGPVLPAATSRKLGLWLIQLAFRGFVKLLRFFRIAECEYHGFEKLDQMQGGFVLSPNHPSIWDAVFIMARVGGLTCILKSSLLKNPLLAGGARLARFIPNDPPGEMVKRCVTKLSEGQRLLLFPEGTRTRKKEGIINEFRGGVAIIAKHARVPVVPVFIQTNSDYGCKGSQVWRPPMNTVRISITVGEPMLCGEQESSHAFLERLREQYIAALSAPH